MPLLNYTSGVDADKSANEIAKCLRSHGAKAVLTEYDTEEGIISAISFKIDVQGRELGFRLPCDYRPVYEIMWASKKAFAEGDSRYEHQKSQRKIQAIKTAWRIVKDWVEAQMALVETRMVKTEEVFLPYVVLKDGKTLAETVSANPQFLLGNK